MLGWCLLILICPMIFCNALSGLNHYLVLSHLMLLHRVPIHVLWFYAQAPCIIASAFPTLTLHCIVISCSSLSTIVLFPLIESSWLVLFYFVQYYARSYLTGLITTNPTWPQTCHAHFVTFACLIRSYLRFLYRVLSLFILITSHTT